MHADNRNMELGNHKDDKNICEKETGDGDQEIGDESGCSVEWPSPVNGRAYTHGKGQGPCDDGSQDEEPQTVFKALPDFSQDRLIVLP